MCVHETKRGEERRQREGEGDQNRDCGLIGILYNFYKGFMLTSLAIIGSC